MPVINDQGPGAPNRQPRGSGASNWQPWPLTDDQGYRARGPLIQIFNNLYAKPVRNLFDLNVAPPGPRLTLL